MEHTYTYTAQPSGGIGMDQIFTIPPVGVVEYCASQNATPLLCIIYKVQWQSQILMKELRRR